MFQCFPGVNVVVMKWTEFLYQQLAMTRKDRIGTLVLFVLLSLSLILPWAITGDKTGKPQIADSSWLAALVDLNNDDAISANKEKKEYDFTALAYERTPESSVKGELFEFDPNTLSPEGWKKLGLRDKTIATIRNYLDKGGRFRQTADLQKIYGLNEKLYARLAPYVRIHVVEDARYQTYKKETKETGYERKKPGLIDINLADTSAFIALPGIGSKLASRIVSFRDKLGGFYKPEQVGETFGLPDSVFQKIRPYLKIGAGISRKININLVNLEDLKSHPYIRYQLANPIIAYRNEHGPFSMLEDLKKIMAISNEVYEKISPYLILE